MSLRTRVKKVVPTPAWRLLRRVKVNFLLHRTYRYDRHRLLRYSSALGYSISRHNLASRITGSYHAIEKGLSLPTPRPRFGETAIGVLLRYLDEYLTRFGEDGIILAALGALNAYVEFNRTAGVSESEIPHLSEIKRLSEGRTSSPPSGGTKTVRRDQIRAAVSPVTEEFFATRSSVRQFEPGLVCDDDVQFAVRAAQSSPAVCNRQFQRLYVISEPKDVVRALEIQGGARGFADQVPMVAVVTSNLRNYWGGGERMQAWTDGGMFAMSFILGLHSREIGSVCLNWSKTEDVDQQFHHAFRIPDEEIIVMLIGFGRLKEEYQVAMSPRVSVRESWLPLSTTDNAPSPPGYRLAVTDREKSHDVT